MEKADKTLHEIIRHRKKSNQPFSDLELVEFFRKIINVFAFCSVFKISHNDIKPSNILLSKKKVDEKNADNLINSKYEPKISDFGTSKQGQETDEKVRLLNQASFTNSVQALTESFASPNVIQNLPNINNYLEDVFSLGMTFL